MKRRGRETKGEGEVRKMGGIFEIFFNFQRNEGKWVIYYFHN